MLSDRLEAMSGLPERRLNIAVGIATSGRVDIISRTLAELRRQTRQADAIIVCAAAQADIPGSGCLAGDVTWMTGPRGLPHQRNVILDKLSEFDLVVFFDDDFVACPRYLEAMEAVFLEHPQVVVATGCVIADGACGPGLGHDDAIRLLKDSALQACDHTEVFDVSSGYGCNMAVRLEPVRRQGLRFDERLPLYAWLEDVDFSRRLLRYGRIVRAAAARGVHLGVKSGRQPGRRLGYSQIANPIYLLQKGTCPWTTAAQLIGRNIIANLIGSVMPEPYVDRRGRIAGNTRAFFDLLVGRLDPSRVLQL